MIMAHCPLDARKVLTASHRNPPATVRTDPETGATFIRIHARAAPLVREAIRQESAREEDPLPDVEDGAELQYAPEFAHFMVQGLGGMSALLLWCESSR